MTAKFGNTKSLEIIMPAMVHSYRDVTEDIVVEVTPHYVPEKSAPESDYYFFAYAVSITNNSTTRIKLLGRHWVIRDGRKAERYVNGEGLVGKQPTLAVGENFEYTSFCPLSTPTGNMRGKFEVQDQFGDRFWIKVPLFFFRRPETFH